MEGPWMRRAIERKRDGEELEPALWHDIVEGYLVGEVDDAQMGAFAMACVWRGLDENEVTALTRAMVESGATLLYPPGMFVVDKHSSGGVSDIVSLVAVPLVAACGVHVAKLSGRALGHTGGTIDKLEAIPGFNATPSMDAFVRQVERVGCAIAAQSDSFVPADKRLYHLRDHTATVPSIGLIAASIVSKKVAAGANAFVFDVKCGTAAFMRDVEQAKALARMLVGVSERFGRRAYAIVSDMNEPLGRSIGTGIETIEAREVLSGREGDERVRAGCVQIAAAMLELAGVAAPRERALRALENGSAYEKFVDMVQAQGAGRAALEALAPDPRVRPLRAPGGGIVTSIDAVRLGNVARALTAHSSVGGIRLHVRVGDRVEPGVPLADVLGEGADPEAILPAFAIGEELPLPRPLVYATI
ncbi:MAG TPA: thymidine phosphorylase [Candidatus Baltobacteraceae bacterium]|nr:thymidine phosphorylase [Candidatus Baltobacteraceae bacterium]